MREHATTGGRAIWRRNKCRLAVAGCTTINAQLEQIDTFIPSVTVSVWVDLAAWKPLPGVKTALRTLT